MHKETLPKIIFALCVLVYFVYCMRFPMQWHFLDGVDLLIHEAGHVLFMPFGEFLTVLGGSLFQVLVPIVFSGYFFFQKELYSGALVLFWVSQSLVNVSVYIKDAMVMQLPLLGDGLHDWNFILSTLHLLPQTAVIGSACYFLGVLTLCAAGSVSLYAAYAEREAEM